MEIARGIAAVIGFLLWSGLMLLLAVAGTPIEGRLIAAMGLCAVLIVAAVGGLRARTPAKAAEPRTPCPACAEDVKLEARVCPFCREDLQKSEVWTIRSRATR
jgi:hypothetical protein